MTAVLRRLVAAINNHDTTAVASCYAPDAWVHQSEWPKRIAAAAWIEAFPVLYESFPDLRVELRHLAATERSVLAEVTLVGTNSGPLHLGSVDRLLLNTDAERVPPTGRGLRMVGVVVLDIADGLIAAERQYWPSAEPLVQLGLLPAAANL